MGYCVYEMPAVREAPLAYRPSLDRLVQQLQATNLQHGGFLPFFESLGQSWFKKRYDKYRLVAKLVPVQVKDRLVHVVVFIDFVRRADVSYGSGKATDFEQRYAALLNRHECEIRDAAENWLSRNPPPSSPPPPPPALIDTLEPLQVTHRVDAFFLHPDFCRAYERLTLDSERTAVYTAMVNITNAEGSEPVGQLMSQGDKCVLYYVRLREPEEGFKHVLMLGLTSYVWDEAKQRNEKKKIEDTWEQVQRRILTLPQNTAGNLYRDAISQFAERAFPDVLLAEEKLWQALWKPEQREVFLALSSEEIHTLESLLATRNFPAVIEGRAGSGKTTLLVYYTAERFTQLHGSSVQFLYLTQSRKLLKRDRDLIESISHSKRLFNERGGSSQARPHYLTYHGFALRQLCQERAQRFSRRNRTGGWMNFNYFSSLLRGHGEAAHVCAESFARSRDCNPEAVWFILRSYIKGYKITERGDDRWMTPEEYEDSEQIPARDRQVSTDLYNKVWKHIWPWYRKLTVPCPENDYEPPFWDDLDLAWEVLEHPRPNAPQYAVIICDEVQDLTRVELAALLRSLSWVHYDLSDLPKRYGWELGELRLPIIFAGDAHQTINPSVFRWQRVSADLAEALVAHLPALPRPKVWRLELEFNYRNARSIGELCNALQHLRQQTLGQRSRLQKLWNLPDHQPNQRIRKLIISGQGELRHLLQEGVLIIGPEDDDPHLEHTKSFWQALGCPLSSEVHPNYVTPVEIKGLEQDNVAVAGFGVLWHLWLKEHRQLAHFWDWRKAAENPEIPEPLRFLVEYFLNRLYVAVSRAREQLWIIETQDGWNAFWGHLEQWLTRPSTPEPTDPPTPEPTDPPPLGSDGDIAELIEVFKGNWKQLAREFERLAHEQKSPEHAERAAFYYGKAGLFIRRNKMLAWKLYYEGKTLEAARKMIELNRKVGSDWFWEAAANNEDVWSIVLNFPIQPRCRHDIADCMQQLVSKKKLELAKQIDAICRLSHLLEQNSSQYREVKPEHRATWDKVYLRLVVSANGLSPEFLHVQQEAYDIASSWIPGTRSALEYYERLAGMAFALKKYKDAVDRWEKAGRTDHKDYFIAKAESEQYPACLVWWVRAGDFDRIRTEYLNHRNTRLGHDDRQRIDRAAREITAVRIKQRLQNQVLKGDNVDDSLVKSLAKLANEERSVAQQLYTELDVPSTNFEQDWIELIKDLIIWPIREREEQRFKQCLQKGMAENRDLSEPIGASIREAHRSLRQRYEIFGILRMFERDWTQWILDLIIWFDANIGGQKEDKFRQAVRGLVEGFAADSEAAVLHPRFRASWQTRHDKDRDWPRFLQYLREIVNSAHQVTTTRANAQDSRLQVGRLCRFVLGLLWQFEKRDRTERDDHPPYWRSRLLDYVLVPERDSKSSVNYLLQIDQDLQPSVQEAIACIADLPEDWLRSSESLREDEPWRSLLDWTDTLAYDFCVSLNETIAAAQSKEDVAPFEWWMLLGRFIEQAPFRRRALDYYRDLLKLSEQVTWQSEQSKIPPQEQIRRRLEQYENSYNRWKEEQRGHDRGPREPRPEIYVNPGERKRSDYLEVKSMNNKAEALVKFMPDEYQVRFQPPPKRGGNPFIRWDPEVEASGPELIRGTMRWRLRCTTSSGQRVVDLEWPIDKPVLYVHADREFVVSFAATETLSS